MNKQNTHTQREGTQGETRTILKWFRILSTQMVIHFVQGGKKDGPQNGHEDSLGSRVPRFAWILGFWKFIDPGLGAAAKQAPVANVTNKKQPPG